MAINDLIRNITVVAALAVPMYNCEGDTTEKNYYGNEGNGGGSGNGSGGSSLVSEACDKTCSDYACAGDFFDSGPGSDLQSPTYSPSECHDVCTKSWADCSDSAMNKVLSCYNQYSCDGEISWVPCLEESDELSACSD